jgi:hypothetical protein
MQRSSATSVGCGTPILNDVTGPDLPLDREPDHPQAWHDHAEELADLGGRANADQAEALLRATVAAGHSPALIRLAELLGLSERATERRLGS